MDIGNTSISHPRAQIDHENLTPPFQTCFSLINAQSLPCHIDEVKSLVKNSNFLVIAVTETWLKGPKVHPSNSINLDNYRLIRNDRLCKKKNKSTKRGGGVALYVLKMKDVVCKIVERSVNDDQVEFLFIELKFVKLNHTFLIGVVYRPNKLISFDSFEIVVGNLIPKYENFVIMGDFNVDMSKKSLESTDFVNLFSPFGGHVLKSSPTRITDKSSTQLDLFITNRADLIKSIKTRAIPTISDHDMVYASLKIQKPKSAPAYKTIRNYNKINRNALLHDASCINWQSIYDSSTVDSKLSIFNQHIISLLNNHAPEHKIKITDTPWFLDKLDNDRAFCEQAYNTWRSGPNRKKGDLNWEKYRSLRNKYNNKKRDAKTKFCKNKFDPNQPVKLFYRNLRDSGLLSAKTEELVTSISPDEFNLNFAKHTQKQNLKIPSYASAQPEDDFVFSNVDEDIVLRAVQSIKSNAVGADQIPIKFIKLLIPVILPILTHVLNFALTSSCFPSSWKIAHILPIPKTNSPKDLNDFRPISILTALSKVLERLMCNQIMAYIRCKDLLHDKQSGFRTNRSTSTALALVAQEIYEDLDNSNFSLMTLLDFSKAFDSVDHDVLLSKLRHLFFFSNTACSLIESYLKNRHQCVKVDDSFSSELPNLAGVPQGSILGPLFFILFINDLPDLVKNSRVHIYADDVQLCIGGNLNSMQECVSNLNHDLSCINSWSTTNGLKLNAKKSQILLIQRNKAISENQIPPVLLGGNRIEFTTVARNLGVMFDNKLSWENHVNSIIQKVYGSLRCLNTLKNYSTVNTRFKLVRSLIMPIFMYCDIVYYNLNSTLNRRLKVAFNSCIRFIYNLRRYDSISGPVKSFLGCSFENFFSYRMTIFMYNLIKYKEPNYLFEKLTFGNSQRHNNLAMQRYNNNYGRYSILTRGVREWNGLPLNLKAGISSELFRRKGLEHFKLKD